MCRLYLLTKERRNQRFTCLCFQITLKCKRDRFSLEYYIVSFLFRCARGFDKMYQSDSEGRMPLSVWGYRTTDLKYSFNVEHFESHWKWSKQRARVNAPCGARPRIEMHTTRTSTPLSALLMGPNPTARPNLMLMEPVTPGRTLEGGRLAIG